ncbi:hypothetical protein BCEP4_1980007 [Burkholderia cepacia]|nr:hypothetical protein BCEP4_1980007 [Burkholderia cepacia]
MRKCVGHSYGYSSGWVLEGWVFRDFQSPRLSQNKLSIQLIEASLPALGIEVGSNASVTKVDI